MKTKPCNAVLCNTAQVRTGNGHAKVNTSGRHKAINSLFIKSLFLLFLFSVLGTSVHAQSLPHEEVLRLAGVPDDMEVERAYRQTKNVYYTLPSGKSIFDYCDIDKIHMEPRTTDERIVTGRNAENDMIIIYKVIDPATQFKPAVLGHNHVIFSDGFVRYYNDRGNILFLDTFTLHTFEEEFSEPQNEFKVFNLDDGIYEVVSETGDMYKLIDSVSGIIVTTYFDELNDWLSTHFEFYPEPYGMYTLPSLEVTYKLERTPMGEFAYRVTLTENTDFFESYNIEPRPAESTINALESSAIEKLEILPNPASDFISVKFPGLDKPTDAEIKIFSMNGMLMHEASIQIDGYYTLVFPENWPSGMYVLNARTEYSHWVGQFIKH